MVWIKSGADARLIFCVAFLCEPWCTLWLAVFFKESQKLLTAENAENVAEIAEKSTFKYFS